MQSGPQPDGPMDTALFKVCHHPWSDSVAEMVKALIVDTSVYICSITGARNPRSLSCIGTKQYFIYLSFINM